LIPVIDPAIDPVIDPVMGSRRLTG
jgi:hypothetical protein